MSYQTSFADLLGAAPMDAQAELAIKTPVPATEKQIEYANKPAPSKFNDYPSSKQVGFAERIAKLKRTEVPPECFKDRALMSRWIDGNKPR
jgi:hypothetical protein